MTLVAAIALVAVLLSRSRDLSTSFDVDRSTNGATPSAADERVELGRAASAASAREALVDEPTAEAATASDDVDALFVRVAQLERRLARDAHDEPARAELESVVSELRTLEDLVDAVLAAVRDGVPGDEERARLVRYGAVRAGYWAASLDARDGRAATGGKFVLDGVEVVARAERASAELLATNLELLIEEQPLVRGREALDRALELRRVVPERADLLDRLVLALALDLDERDRHALARWLLADPSDTASVVEGLEQLFANGDTWLALELASEAFELGDWEARGAVAEAVAQAAPVDVATAFALERFERLRNEPTIWFEIGTREGGSDALFAAYGDLREAESGATERRVLVSGMFEARAEDLRSIASEDPEDDVAVQALLTLTSRGSKVLVEDVDTVRSVVERCSDERLGMALSAASNLLRRGTRGSAVHDGAIDVLRGVAADSGRRIADRRAAFDLVAPHLGESDRAVLAALLEQD
ncbi:MAG: hypothetical protein R3F34_12700 [Planctomycetota bacterium]